MGLEDKIHEALKFLNPDLKSEILKSSVIKTFPKNTEILREGQYVKVVPIVIDGLIKVFTGYEEKELLIYYIRPLESCIMSFASGLQGIPSNVFAITEEETTVLLMPTSHIPKWIKLYPDINALFFEQYNLRYSELLDTINHLLFKKMDMRLLEYLRNKRDITSKNPLKISHREIANELGTAREVISRVMKKLENEGFIKQHSNSIEIF